MTHLVEEVSFFEMDALCVGCAASQSKRKWSLPFRLGPTRIGTRATFWCIVRTAGGGAALMFAVKLAKNFEKFFFRKKFFSP